MTQTMDSSIKAMKQANRGIEAAAKLTPQEGGSAALRWIASKAAAEAKKCDQIEVGPEGQRRSPN